MLSQKEGESDIQISSANRLMSLDFSFQNSEQLLGSYWAAQLV